MRHDFYFKQLLTTLFPDFIELFFPTMFAYLDPTSSVPMDKELLGDPDLEQISMADLVMKVRFKNEDAFYLVHIETQAQPQPDFPRRFFKYFAKLYDKYGLPVYPIVVFSFEEPLKKQRTTYDINFPDLHVLKFNYRAVQLNRLYWKDYLNVLNPVAAALMSRMRMSRMERFRVKLECLKLLKKTERNEQTNRLVSWFVDGYLNLMPEEMEKYEQLRDRLEPEVKEAVMKMETSWSIKGREEGLKEGLEKGLQEGLQQGRGQGMAMLLERQLSLRFSDISPATIAKIHTLDSESLLRLGVAVPDFKAQSDLVDWLSKNV